MLITWKDLAATVLAITMAVFSYLYINGYHFPLITGYRTATVVLLALGIGMCALSPTTGVNYSNPWVMTAAILGGFIVLLAIGTFLMGTKTMFLTTAAAILALWAVATFRHLIGA